MTVEHEGLVFSLVYGHPIAKGNLPDGWREGCVYMCLIHTVIITISTHSIKLGSPNK